MSIIIDERSASNTRKMIIEGVKQNHYLVVTPFILQSMFAGNAVITQDSAYYLKEADKWADENGLVFQRNHLDLEKETYIFAPRK